MPTLKKRLNITLSKDMDTLLQRIAARDSMPVATKTIELIKVALEIEEDQTWDKIAQKRDTKNAKFIPHENTWL